MSEVNDFQFKVIVQCEQDEFNPTRKQYCEYLIEMNGVERPLKDILKENIEQQATINEYKKDNAKWRRKCLDLLVIIRTELLPRISDDEVKRLQKLIDDD